MANQFSIAGRVESALAAPWTAGGAAAASVAAALKLPLDVSSDLVLAKEVTTTTALNLDAGVGPDGATVNFTTIYLCLVVVEKTAHATSGSLGVLSTEFTWDTPTFGPTESDKYAVGDIVGSLLFFNGSGAAASGDSGTELSLTFTGSPGLKATVLVWGA